MAASSLLMRHKRSPAEQILRTLHLLRHMTPVSHQNENETLRVNWAVIVTNAIGAVVGIALTASVTGVIYLVWTVPVQQQKILENQAEMKVKIEKIEENDRRQDLERAAMKYRLDHQK